MTNDNNVTAPTWADPRNLGETDRVFFKPEEGKTKRIKLMGPPVRAHVQFIQGLGFIRSHSEYTMKGDMLTLVNHGLDVELTGKEPQLMWMVPVLVYETDKSGQIGRKKAENIEYEFQLWSFYVVDYKRLRGMVIEWGEEDFNRKDLLITGKKNGKYTNSDIAIAAKEALCLQDGMNERVDAEFAGYKYRDAEKWIARTVTEEELREACSKDQAQGSAKSTIKG